ncbi:MAG: DUF58 domain-containing protein [Candidatus Eremiobacteraeota bacterium]|nr:DUF58 domain-containing protein [Candidatus Eremiobacteraeota bacterium]
MKPLPKLRALRVWLTPRAFWLGAAAAFVLALGSFAPVFTWIGAAAFAALLVAGIADAMRVVSGLPVTVLRNAEEHFALRRHSSLHYRIVNSRPYALRVTIVETPVALLRLRPEDLTAVVPASSAAQLERDVLPLARGTALFGSMYVTLQTSLGLLERRCRFEAPATVRVFPDLSAVERYGSLRARNRIIETGLRRMRERGVGTEFESLREWSTGDAFRSIDWKATARRGRLMVSQYEVERTQNVVLMLDAGRLMTPWLGDQRKFDYAITAALSVGVIAGLASDKVGIIAFAKDILVASAPSATGGTLARLIGEVHDVQPRMEESDYDNAFAYLRTHLRKRSLVIFFTDMFDPVAQSALLAQIGSLARRHLIVCVFMNDAAVQSALAEPAQDLAGAYRAGVALELERERRSARAVLERIGVQTIDVPAQQLTTALIDEYLRIKQRALV